MLYTITVVFIYILEFTDIQYPCLDSDKRTIRSLNSGRRRNRIHRRIKLVIENESRIFCLINSKR